MTTTLDATLQEAANAAVEHGLRRLDKRRGYRKPAAQRRRRRACRSTRSRTIAGTGRSPPATSSPRSSSPRPKTGAGAASDRPLSGRPRARRLRLDAPHVGGRLSSSRAISSTCGSSRSTRRPATADGHARADAARRRRARRDRQPHRADQGDGRRLELQPQQVQPRGAGVPAARIDLQADRLHGGDRSRVHAGVDSRRRAGQLPGRQRSRSTARRTTTTSSKGRSRCAMRSRTRATFRPIKMMEALEPEERARLRQAVRVRARTSRPTCRLRSAPATPRCSR